MRRRTTTKHYNANGKRVAPRQSTTNEDMTLSEILQGLLNETILLADLEITHPYLHAELTKPEEKESIKPRPKKSIQPKHKPLKYLLQQEPKRSIVSLPYKHKVSDCPGSPYLDSEGVTWITNREGDEIPYHIGRNCPYVHTYLNS